MNSNCVIGLWFVWGLAFFTLGFGLGMQFQIHEYRSLRRSVQMQQQLLDEREVALLKRDEAPALPADWKGE